jgi:DNA-binding transcriptional LysR family regulator
VIFDDAEKSDFCAINAKIASMNLTTIRYFLGLADDLHFWNTAEKVNITQSALSRQIQGLEAELGVRLFDRSKRRVELTSAGRFMAQEWRRILPDIDNIHRQARQISAGEVGTLTISYPGSVMYSILPDLVIAFRQQYPQVRIELTERCGIEVEADLLDYRSDIAFMRNPPDSPMLAWKKIRSEPYAVVVAEGHWLRTETFTGLHCLENEPFALPSRTTDGDYMHVLFTMFDQYGYRPHVVFESNYGGAILSLVARGLAVSVMPLSYRAGSPMGVRFIPLPHQTDLYVIWRNDVTCAIVQNVLPVVDTVVAALLPVGAGS